MISSLFSVTCMLFLRCGYAHRLLFCTDSEHVLLLGSWLAGVLSAAELPRAELLTMLELELEPRAGDGDGDGAGAVSGAR